ncbi:hypothetical protein EMIHUDRAFT_122361 [Emiliania huxleyi CCMP1516]|uniref:SAM domain-containing protein n=2 Tax=Emiliania huxleyi TaxID=2903 RepID=A0A0D3KP96_EMIH1|nr:hypothetical protein EMIHUDRAFT_122361 [Emiliania huxleyi CCMP1516]EOD37581.1 hypothetical protein EMIHUDRAFT_122361 [Emiliania huxleyi CCMP1516]|eukprot:XP_005790010.1 hypothetical protein EMIHUDRAFT_122361 [Emiliania huxleyi CCMP1516]
MDGVGEVTAFLTKLGLEQCVQAVVHNGFYTSMEALRGATYEEAPSHTQPLVDSGVRPGHAKLMLSELSNAGLSTAPLSVSSDPAGGEVAAFLRSVGLEACQGSLDGAGYSSVDALSRATLNELVGVGLKPVAALSPSRAGAAKRAVGALGRSGLGPAGPATSPGRGRGRRDAELIAIGQLRRLHTLRIGDERGYGGDQWGFTDVGLTAVAVGCPALRILTFKGFDAASTTQTARHAVTAAPLFALAAHNSGVLEQLAWECEGPLAEALGALLQRCQRLMHLKVSSCDDCDDSALRVVGAHGKSLITLDASFTAVTGDGVISLVQGLPGLRGLNASYCDEVDEDDAQACEAVLVARGGSFGTIGREFGHPHWKGR